MTNRILKNPRQQRFFKTNDLQELFTFSEYNEKSNSDPQTSLYLKAEGLSNVCLATAKENNRFDERLQRLAGQSSKSSKVNDQYEDFELDLNSSQDEDDNREFDKFESLGESNQSRFERLRNYARDLSRRIGQGSLENYDSKTKKTNQISRFKSKKGIHVDGKRIRLVAKQCSYDSGEGLDLARWRSDEAGNDWIVDSLLSGRSISEIQTGKKHLDSDIYEEAKRVAGDALKGIQASGNNREYAIDCKFNLDQQSWFSYLFIVNFFEI